MFFSDNLKKLFSFSDPKLLSFVTKKFRKNFLIFFLHTYIYENCSNILGKKFSVAFLEFKK